MVEVDAILVGVKAWRVPGAAKAMRPMVGKNTCVVPLQNGAVVRIGKEVGVETPVNSFIYRSLLPMGDGHAAKSNSNNRLFQASPGHPHRQ